MTDPAPYDPRPGQAETLAPGLRRVLAPNPSPMTYRGTNSYLLGEDELAVIDPGPADRAHLAALLDAIGGARVAAIVVTHAHLDHSPLARPLAEATGAPVFAFGDAEAGRSATMARLAARGGLGGGEGRDAAFSPDEILPDGGAIAGDGWRLEALWTPGHFASHLSLKAGEAVFSGDHVQAWASTLVSPPDGDIGAFMASCRRLREWGGTVMYPGHGPAIADPAARIDWLVAHRERRAAQVAAALGPEGRTAAQIAGAIYTDVAPALLPAAARNVLAQLIDLAERGLARAEPEIAANALWHTP